MNKFLEGSSSFLEGVEISTSFTSTHYKPSEFLPFSLETTLLLFPAQLFLAILDCLARWRTNSFLKEVGITTAPLTTKYYTKRL